MIEKAFVIFNCVFYGYVVPKKLDLLDEWSNLAVIGYMVFEIIVRLCTSK